jgi:hypothetical protein
MSPLHEETIKLIAAEKQINMVDAWEDHLHHKFVNCIYNDFLRVIVHLERLGLINEVYRKTSGRLRMNDPQEIVNAKYAKNNH